MSTIDNDSPADDSIDFWVCFHQAPVALALVSDGIIRDGNQAALHLIGGARREDFLGRPIWELIHPDFHADVQERLKVMTRTGEPAPPVEIRLVSDDGSEVWVEVSSNPVPGRDDQLIQVSLRDVSERRRAESALRESERRFRLLAENAEDIVFRFRPGPGGGYDYVSPAAKTVVGYTPEEHYADPELSLKVIHPDDRHLLDELIQEAEWRGPRKAVMRWIRKDGAIIWTEQRIVPVRDDEGELIALEGIVRDITAQREAEAALRESEEKYRTLVETSPTGIFIISDTARFVHVNPAFCRMLGRPEEELLALSSVLDIVDPEERADAEEGLRNALFGEDAVAVDHMSIRQPSGTLVELELHGVQATYEGRTALVGTALDVTEVRKAREALRSSEEFLHSIIENLPVQVFVKDTTNFRYVLFNRSIEHLVGGNRDELIGKTDHEIFPAEVAEWFHKQDLEVFRRGEPIEIQEEKVTLPNRGVCYLRTRKIPVFDEDGQPKHILGITEDITDEKLTAERIRTSEGRYHALSELLLSFGFSFLVHPDGKRSVEWVTDTMADVYGFTIDEIKEIDWFSRIHAQDADEYVRYTHELIEGRPAVAELRVVRKDGAVRWVRAKSFPVWDSDEQRVVRIFGAGQDITSQKELELELMRQKDRAEEMTRVKDAFLANMSHEIRTPLASIIGAADILHTEVGDEAHELVMFIRRGGERLMETLSSVLDLAQLQGRSIALHPETFDLRDEIRGVVDLFRRRTMVEGSRLEMTVSDGPPVYVSMDRIAVGRVISNLLSNALKFTHEGSIAVHVDEEDNTAIVEVTDTGEGIAPDFLPFIYDEFSQASTGPTRSHEGAGLGLAISKRLVGLLGGQIDAASTPGEGTTFTVRLPLAQVELRKSASGIGPASPAMPDVRVLVVDDDPAVGGIVAHYLQDGATVQVADSGRRAEELARQETFDVILMDINLRGGETGEDVMRAMRRLPAYAKTPFIALTAYALPGDKERFLQEGFDGYVSKPFRRQDLAKAVNAVLPNRRRPRPRSDA
jgi:PAS domain S-box-containing protein